MLMMMVMMMMRESDALPRSHLGKTGGHSRHSPKTHKKSSDPTDAGSQTVSLQLDTSALVLPRSIRPLWNHSISPWTYNTSYDADRFPPFISEAKCSLQGCLNMEGTEDLSLESKPIWHQILVLRRVAGSDDETYHYRLESRLISVGCTCVRPSVRHQH
ncbi:interleukin-17F-like [Lampris incognitus]|uniref:interleukin-17F-like n=1 Tax=Lampris incognitus TaxID=2546036 RepID=UPI0024B53E80|nr:interleukin-17F-like [Lampris incognitus]